MERNKLDGPASGGTPTARGGLTAGTTGGPTRKSRQLDLAARTQIKPRVGALSY